jgi:hypothetical protein
MRRRTFQPAAGLTDYFIGASVRAYPRRPHRIIEHLVAHVHGV